MRIRKLARFLYAQRVKGFGVKREPALDDEAAGCFAQLLSESDGYLEFGAGGSTLLADRMCTRTLTVEGDPYYAKAVRKSLSSRTSVTIINPRIGFTREWSVPIFTRPTSARLRRWRRYIRQPFVVLDQLGWFPDFILVDGRFRRACILEAASQARRKHKPVNILVDDYFKPGREHYHEVEQWVGTPAAIGRAALFELSPESPLPVPGQRVIDEAAGDYR